jgi:hypothetical protein
LWKIDSVDELGGKGDIAVEQCGVAGETSEIVVSERGKWKENLCG